jgi:hypothetical protein
LVIPLPFIPLTKQLTDPVEGVQLSDLPAAVRAEPEVGLTETTSLVGKESFHCKAAGALPDVFRTRFKATEPP